LDLQYDVRTASYNWGTPPEKEVEKRFREWERKYLRKMPLLFTRREKDGKWMRFPAAAMHAVVQYAQQTSIDQANDFLRGFWEIREVGSRSPEHTAYMYIREGEMVKDVNGKNIRVRLAGRPGQLRMHKLFVYYLLAHNAGVKSLKGSAVLASDWNALATGELPTRNKPKTNGQEAEVGTKEVSKPKQGSYARTPAQRAAVSERMKAYHRTKKAKAKKKQ